MTKKTSRNIIQPNTRISKRQDLKQKPFKNLCTCVWMAMLVCVHTPVCVCKYGCAHVYKMQRLRAEGDCLFFSIPSLYV